MVSEISPVIRAVSRVIGLLIFLFAMWFLSRYISQKPKKIEKGKTEVVSVGAWLIGLGGIFLGLIFLFLVILAIAFTPEITPLRILLAIGGFLLAILFIWSGYEFTRMAKGTWKKPEIPKKIKQALHVTDADIDKIKRKNAQFSWWLIIIGIVSGYLTKSLANILCSQKECILSIAIFDSSLFLGIFFFLFAWFCKRYKAVGFLGNIRLLTEQKARFWSVIYTLLGIVAIIIGMVSLFF